MSKTSQENDHNPKDRDTTISVAARTIAVQGNTLDSKDLFSSGREIIIMHGAESYRLRLTSQNKLILTK
ncbi:hemin uptake protein HemP [Nitrobacteraceae bacterium UC4446_H13]